MTTIERREVSIVTPDATADARLLRPLLIVGSHDPVVIDLNRRALAELTCEASIEIVPGATHLFDEPGTLEQVAALATAWFQRWL